MKPYSIDLREKIVSAVEKGDSSVRKVAQRFDVSKNCVQRLITQKRTQGHIVPRKQGGSMVSPVMKYKEQMIAIFEKQTDATLAEYCELLFDETGLWISQSTMCRTFQRLKLPLKKTMDAAAFKVYVSKCLVPQLWKGAVVVMDNLPAHKVKAIAPLIEAVGAKILYLSPYSPEFNPIEHWWSQLKAFLRQFSPKTSHRVDLLIKIAIDLMNPEHLRNWFAHCCYCPS